MNFRELAELGERLKSTPKRSEMINISADFLKRLKPEEVEPAVCMLLGRPFPKSSEERMEVSWATLRDLILRITASRARGLEEAFGKTGDLGAATAILFKSCKKRQRLFSEKPLELLEVQKALREIAKS